MEDQNQTLVEHLTEFRYRLIRVLLFVFIGCAVAWNSTEEIMDWIRRPIAPYLATGTGGLVFTGVMDKFISHIKVAILGGVILSCPFWFYQIWKFISPALYKNEKKYAASFIIFGTTLFLTGVSFAYFLVFPAAFEFLMTFGGTTDKPLITIAEYLSFFVTTALLFGVSFELPLILLILAMLGIIDERFLRTKRRYAIVLLATASAILTPPDILSMTMMLIPMMALYELSIVLIKLIAKPKVLKETI